MPDRARNLIVRVNSYMAGLDLPSFGSGIVIAAPTTNQLYVVTAKHVVDGATRFDVSLATGPETVLTGRLLWTSEDRDIAVLSVEPSAEQVAEVRRSFSRLGRIGSLSANSDVYPVGCPAGECWLQPTADRVIIPGPVVLEFQSAFVREGHSGGGLFDETWELVGMVTQGDLRRAEAVPIDLLLGEVRRVASISDADWARMSTLRRPAVPRRGYRFSLGAVALMAIGQPDILPAGGGAPLNGLLEQRLPSARVTLSGATGSRLTWHVGALRLAPSNVSITAGVAGLSLVARSSNGRFAGRIFGEGAAGRVESRYDLGGYLATTGTATQYVPVWGPENRDGIGFGGGIAAELVVFRHTVVEVTAGSWSFGMPESAPDVPRLYLGGGLRLGR